MIIGTKLNFLFLFYLLGYFSSESIILRTDNNLVLKLGPYASKIYNMFSFSFLNIEGVFNTNYMLP